MNRVLLAVFVLAALLYLPGVGAGFMADDHFFAFALTELPAEHPLHNLFALVDTRDEVRVFRDHGVLPWWAADDMRIVFWRPLPSLTHWLDFRLFGRSAAAMHLVSIAWYVAVVALAARVFTRFFDARLLAVPVAVFALDDAHVVNVQWIASRNDLVGATFLLAATLAFLRVREGRGGPLPVLVAFAAALASKESSVVFPVLATAHALLLPGRPARRLLVAVWALAAAYLAFYALSGFGPSTLYYLNPLKSPALWAGKLVETGAAHLSILATGVPLHTLTPAPLRDAPAAAAACAVATVATLALFARHLREDRAAAFFAVWTLAGLALVTTSFPDPRLLFVASIGFAGLLGRLAAALLAAHARRALAALAVLHLGLAPVVTQASLGVVGTFREGHDALVAALRDAVDYDHLADAPVHVFFLNWHQRETSPLATLQLIRGLPTGTDVGPLLAAPGVPYATRVDRAFRAADVSYHALTTLPAVEAHAVAADTLRVTAPDLFPTVFERLYLTSADLRPGTTRALPAFTATIEAVEDGRVTAARFTFPKPLASADYRFLAWRDGEWQVERFDRVAAR